MPYSFLIILAGLFTLPQAQAALGASPQKIQALIHKAHFAVSQYVDGPVTINEYSGENGTVFAVSWRGSTHPDLEVLMGKFFPEFKAALRKAKETHRGFGPLRITRGNFHLELSGRMRNVRGRAWITADLPKGVATHELR